MSPTRTLWQRPLRLAGLSLALLAAATQAGCAAPPAWMVAQGRATMNDHRHFHNAPVAAMTLRAVRTSPSAAVTWKVAPARAT